MNRPLPTRTSIRLLKFDSQAYPISCSITIVDLNNIDIPPYQCLSYTWGSPFREEHELTPRYIGPGTSHAIIVDKLEVEVTFSLYEFLSHHLQSTPERPIIWIDAICIDQRHPEGTAEREIQVTMMDRIYAQAEHVLVWLGPCESEQSHAIVRSLRSLASIDINTLQVAEFELGGKLDAANQETYRKLGIEFIERRTWKLLREFFERSWFQRMWVTQEAALAQSLSFHVGSETLTWEDLDRSTLQIYHFDRLFADIWTAPPGIVEALQQPDEELRKTDETTMAWVSIRSILMFREETKRYGMQRSYGRVDDDSATGVTLTRAPLGGPQTWKGFRTHVLHKNRKKKSGDPRDKIYAMLGLISGLSDGQGNKLITPDYSDENTATKLYTDITRMVFQDDSRIVWGAAIRIPPVEDESVRLIKELPSWVPDFSARDLPLHLMSTAHFLFNASAHLKGGFLKTDDIYTWGVKGLQVDEVVQLGERYEEIKAQATITECLDIISKVDLKKIYQEKLERGFILQRTLTADMNLGFQIPQEEIAEIFRSYLILLEASRINQSQIPLEGKELENAVYAACSAYSILEETWQPSPSSIFQASQDLHRQSPSSNLQNLIDLASRYEANLNRIFSCRRLLLTKAGRVGIAAASIRVGDGVWVIPPEKTYHILRKVPARKDVNNENVYTLVGDAYVDGIMYGEAARSAREEDLVDVILV